MILNRLVPQMSNRLMYTHRTSDVQPTAVPLPLEIPTHCLLHIAKESRALHRNLRCPT